MVLQLTQVLDPEPDCFHQMTLCDISNVTFSSNVHIIITECNTQWCQLKATQRQLNTIDLPFNTYHTVVLSTGT